MGAILRTFPAISVQMLDAIGYGGYVLAILILCFVWLKSHEIRFEQVGLAVLMSIMFSPHLHTHDLSLLLIPALCVAVELTEHKVVKRETSIFLFLIISVIFAFTWVFSSFSIIYITYHLLALLLWVPSWWKAHQKKQPG